MTERTYPGIVGGETVFSGTTPAEYLNTLLGVELQRISPVILRLDLDMEARVKSYARELAEFLEMPQIQTIESEMIRVESDATERGREYLERIKSVNKEIWALESEDSSTREAIRIFEQELKGVSRNKASTLELVFVRLKRLSAKKKLEFLTKVAISVTEIAAKHGFVKIEGDKTPRLREDLARIISEREGRKAVKAELAGQQREVAEILTKNEKYRRGLFEELDNWAIEDWDRFLVYLLYYRRVHVIGMYAKRHGLLNNDLNNQLSYYGFSERGRPNSIPTANKPSDTTTLSGESEDSLILPLKIIINGVQFSDSQVAEKEFLVMKTSYKSPPETKAQVFDKILRLTEYRSRGLKPRGYTLFKADDTRGRLGGKGRLRVGRRRIIINELYSATGELILEIVNVVHRDYPRYF